MLKSGRSNPSLKNAEPLVVRDTLLKHMDLRDDVAQRIKVETALDNLIALQIPFVNRMLEILTQYVAEFDITIAFTGAKSFEEHSDFLLDPDANKTIRVDAAGNLEANMIKQFAYVAMGAMGLHGQYKQEFESHFEKDILQHRTLAERRVEQYGRYFSGDILPLQPAKKQKAMARLETTPYKLHSTYPSLTLPQFHVPRKMDALIHEVGCELKRYREEARSNLFVPVLLACYVKGALKDDSGPAAHAIEYSSGGALQLVATPDDNNSFYAAAAKSLTSLYHVPGENTSQEWFEFCNLFGRPTAVLLRQKVADYMAERPEKYNKEYVSHVRDGIAADETQQKILAEILGRPMILLSGQGTVAQVLGELSSSDEPLFIFHYESNGQEHFDPVVKSQKGAKLDGKEIYKAIREKQYQKGSFHAQMSNAAVAHQDIVRAHQAGVFESVCHHAEGLRRSILDVITPFLNAYCQSEACPVESLPDSRFYSHFVGRKINNGISDWDHAMEVMEGPGSSRWSF